MSSLPLFVDDAATQDAGFGPLRFFVAGTPGTAGSKRGYIYRTKDGRQRVGMAPDNPRARPWMALVADEATQHWGDRQLYPGPVRLSVTFVRPRPKSHFSQSAKSLGAILPRFQRVLPTSRPDTTKLVRCIEDALTRVIWRDDSQVVQLQAEKRWGDPEGAIVQIHFLDGEPV